MAFLFRKTLIIFLLLARYGFCSEVCRCLKEVKGGFLIETIEGKVICAKNEKEFFTPASILKILTALSALHYLGEGFRFKTEFYMGKNDLKIKAYGDPLLVSEIIDEITDELSKRLPSVIDDIIIDDSFFSEDIKIPGLGNSLNPYDAPVGAFCANFNTVYFKREKGKIISAEPQTPIVPFVIDFIKRLPQGRCVFSHNVRDLERYAGELFRYFLEKHGVKVKGEVRFGKITDKDRIVYTYYSKFSLKEVIRKMMRYSNNFIANQIMLFLGARLFGPPAELKKGVMAIRRYANEVLCIKGMKIFEGSGICRKNRVTCKQMAKILKAFFPYRSLMRKKGDVYYKTGTLKGIRTKAGYIGERYIFVIYLESGRVDLNCISEKLTH